MAVVLLWLVFAAASSGTVRAQGALTNGSGHDGSIAPAGESDTWTVELNAGDTVELRVGAATFSPRVELYAPGGALVDSGSVNSPANRDAGLNYRATATGTFNVVVRSHYAAGTGDYRLHLVRVPGVLTISAGDEGGALANGASRAGVIAVGDLDAWSFSANAGDSLEGRVGATGFSPLVRLYGPDGALLDSGSVNSPSNRDAGLAYRTTASGVFTLVVESLYAGGTGAYRLDFAQVPGSFVVPPDDEGGALANGGRHAGTLSLGDLDLWSFAANAGDSLELRVGATDFSPAVRLYGPDGALIGTGAVNSPANRDAGLRHRAATAGTYSVIVQSHYGNGAGTYRLDFAQVPGSYVVPPDDEGGALANGGRHAGILALGDLDLWSFTANAGDSLELRVGATDFSPSVKLYGPDGALIETGAVNSPANRDAGLTYRTTTAGTYSVVVQSHYGNGAGSYRLYLAQAPGNFVVPAGDEGGPLANGGNHDGALDLGDLELWSFPGRAGESIELRAGTTDFSPVLRLYGPDGALVASASVNSPANRDVRIAQRLTSDGLYTATLSSWYGNGAGPYRLRHFRVLSPFVVPAGDEGGSLTGGLEYGGTVELGDEDGWHFTACRDNPIALRVDTTDFSPWLGLYGPDGALIRSASVNSPANRTVSIAHRATAHGTYAVLLTSHYGNASGSYRLTSNGLSDGLKLCVPEVAGADLRLIAVGGVPNAEGVLLSVADVTAPGPLWTPVVTNRFDGFGVFEHTGPFDGDPAQEYFRLRMP